MFAQQFQPRRAFLYLRKYLFEHSRSYGLLFFAIAAFLGLWLGVYLNFSNPFLFSERWQLFYYFVTLFLSGCLSSGILFSELSSKDKSIQFLLIPASMAEKFLVSILFAVVVFFIGCSGVFSLVNAIAVTIANYKYETHWEAINLLTLDQYANPFFEGPVSDVFFLYFPAQAIFIYCSVHFRRYALFKAIVVIGLLWVAGIAAFLFYLNSVPTGMLHVSTGEYEVLEVSGDNVSVKLPSWLWTFTSFFLKYLLTPLLLLAAYFRLKEKEL